MEIPNLAGKLIGYGMDDGSETDWGRATELLIEMSDKFADFVDEAQKAADPLQFLIDSVFDPIDAGESQVVDARNLARVFLTTECTKKILVIKNIRQLTGLNLRDAKFLVDSVFAACTLETSDQGPMFGSVVKKISIPYLGELEVVKTSVRLAELEAQNKTLDKVVGDLQEDLRKALEAKNILHAEVEELGSQLSKQKDCNDRLRDDLSEAADIKSAYFYEARSLHRLIDLVLPGIEDDQQIARVLRTEADALGKIRKKKIDEIWSKKR